jgi:hypothetical protein
MSPLLLAVVLQVAPTRASCHAPVASLRRHVDAVGVAFRRMDEHAMRAARARVEAELPCVDAALAPQDAARIHETIALEAFLEGDGARVKEGLRAALRADPRYEPHPELAPAGGVLHRLYEDARALPDARTAPLPPRAARLRIDGATADARPLEGPVLVQRLESDGLPSHSALLQGKEPLPEWALSPTPQGPSVARSLGWTAGGLALASAGLWTGFLANRAVYARESEAALAGKGPSQRDLDGRWRVTNGLGTAAIVGSTLGLGVGVAAVVSW